MPSGDAQRTWFPEMVARLRAEWHEEMSIPALIGLRDELDEMLRRIRAGRNIQAPIITCGRWYLKFRLSQTPPTERVA